MKVVAFAGGVGGAKLADGLARSLPPEDLTVVVNTADDFEHFGLKISPDLDTVCYTLAGLANPVTGWGRMGESWQVLKNLEKLSAPNWFRLGDQDLATHLERSRRIVLGESLSEVAAHFCMAWGIKSKVLPMSDQVVSTMVAVEGGELSFQEYFVKLQCAPAVSGFRFAGIENAKPAPGVLEAIRGAEIILICPSNPWVSIAPILAIDGIRSAMAGKNIIAVSPIIGGKAVKGPAAKMYSELNIEPSALAVAAHYANLITGFVFDQVDTSLEPKIKIPYLITDTIMKNIEDRKRLADEILDWANDQNNKNI
ncbi:MAG: 2-phospho-L-lactate transferase [Chloroflexi bacterium]|jgi:LPPG:FO 2-phospho-L-lactate transferase|nr:2-phospho-L-lactate transferase [Chloroflexota bacterium]MBT3670750.1 2-phospho-L-lactate transferase [Chloroflexota bacterium]MBT4305118.1 2-phospho-L-lactate transferase [Chloroflexota bacterium]MBT4533360.1 2-phospho-L-lactate transferase [Chloroflexota bacterium]MBT4682884.1 2-phospho-L-lactate transferase [Chloroflexota bacterium]